MAQGKRPRVAAIGFHGAGLESISHLCGELRQADTLEDYLLRYNWIETDIVIANDLQFFDLDPSVNLITIGSVDSSWTDTFAVHPRKRRHNVTTNASNTERELGVPNTLPNIYKTLAVQLSNELMARDIPPAALRSSRPDQVTLVETTSGKSVAMRIGLPARKADGVATIGHPVALFLPQVTNLTDWFATFLSDVNENDPSRVPQPPPRLSKPSDWYTPEERALAARIEKASLDINDLIEERERLQTELIAVGESGDRGIRRVLWADGDELVAGVSEILVDFGFEIQDMDAGLQPNEPKHEDLRLTLLDRPGWEAIVEVKGYTNGTRTNDARQIREHREHYLAENGRLPDLTLWLANPFRQMDPSSRPTLGGNVGEAADNVGAVHALTVDLYQQWILIKTGALDANDVVQDLIGASPGHWSPTATTNNQ